MVRGLLFAAALLAAASPTLADDEKPKAEDVPLLRGAVRSQTARRVYLDHGTAAGLAPGLEVSQIGRAHV